MPVFDLEPNDLVVALGKEGPEALEGAQLADAQRAVDPIAVAPAQSPKTYCFTGFLGKPITANAVDWCVLYLDWELETWLLIERSGVVTRKRLTPEEGAPGPQDALWVKADTAVGSGTGTPLSITALFLMGGFTRASAFEVEPLLGGTGAAAGGGYGLAGQSPPRCCNKTNRRP